MGQIGRALVSVSGKGLIVHYLDPCMSDGTDLEKKEMNNAIRYIFKVDKA